MQRQGIYGQVAGDIGAQFTPQMRLAQARLGNAPLLADSGYANRLNREIQQSAYGQLAQGYSSQYNSLLNNLINQRIGQKQGYVNSILGSAQKKPSFADYATSLAGSLGGAALGHFLPQRVQYTGYPGQ